MARPGSRDRHSVTRPSPAPLRSPRGGRGGAERAAVCPELTERGGARYDGTGWGGRNFARSLLLPGPICQIHAVHRGLYSRGGEPRAPRSPAPPWGQIAAFRFHPSLGASPVCGREPAEPPGAVRPALGALGCSGAGGTNGSTREGSPCAHSLGLMAVPLVPSTSARRDTAVTRDTVSSYVEY